jgi:DDE_Tnp_1-associated
MVAQVWWLRYGGSGMVAYGQSKLDVLRKRLPFKNGIPSYNTLGLVLSMVNPKVFAQFFSE